MKRKYLDFEHPPAVRKLIIFDGMLVMLILLVYAMIQHVIPSHYLSSLAVIDEVPSATTEISVLPTASMLAPVIVPDSSFTEVSTNSNASDPVLSNQHISHFSENVEITNHSYKSPNISIEIKEHSSDDEFMPQHWYEADIYLNNIHCLQTYVHDGNDRMAGRDIKTLSRLAGSVLAINGDYALTTNSGVIIRNSEVIRDNPGLAEICVLYSDGTMECYAPEDYNSEEVLSKGAWQAWTFGPSLLDSNGNAKTSFSSYYGSVLENNPRTILGYYEPGHYCFVVLDGRQSNYAIGYDMESTAKLMESLGCKAAFNLDGGRSSQMTFGSEYVNSPYKDGRYVGDIVYIKDLYPNS